MNDPTCAVGAVRNDRNAVMNDPTGAVGDRNDSMAAVAAVTNAVTNNPRMAAARTSTTSHINDNKQDEQEWYRCLASARTS